MPVELYVEDSRSRSGLHRARMLAFIVSREGSVTPVHKHPRARLESKSRGLYSRGSRLVYKVGLSSSEVAVQVGLVRNQRGHVKGYISVINSRGEVYRVVLRRLKARMSSGDPSYSWAVEAVMRHLGLDRVLRRVNLGGGGGEGSS